MSAVGLPAQSGHEPSTPGGSRTLDGPLVQSVTIGFRVLQLATTLLFAAWLFSGVRSIPPGSQAVVLRFGAVERVLPPGIALCWPYPVERLVLLPGRDRQTLLPIEISPRPSSQVAAATSARPADLRSATAAMRTGLPFTAGPGSTFEPAAGTMPDAGVMPGGTPGAGSTSTMPAVEGAFGDTGTIETGSSSGPAGFLTADGEVVLLQASLSWRISDAAAFLLARDHVEPTLRRLFLEAAVHQAATHPLDDFLAVRPERAHDPAAQDARAAVRLLLVRAVNDALANLAAAGAPLGVEVTRSDVTPSLPPQAKSSFDAVLDAAQRADEAAAAARTDAAKQRQQADRERDRILAEAHAAAAERVSTARTQTATITALEAEAASPRRPALLFDLYRERIGGVLHQAGSVSTVGPDGGPLLLAEPKEGVR